MPRWCGHSGVLRRKVTNVWNDSQLVSVHPKWSHLNPKPLPYCPALPAESPQLAVVTRPAYLITEGYHSTQGLDWRHGL